MAGINVKKDFPFFKKTKLVYLDSAATTQKPKKVIDAITDYYESHNANVHRGVYSLAEETTQLYELARSKVAKFIGANQKEIVFVRNATEAINIVARSWGAANIRKGDVILLTQMEHHSNIVPWQMLAKAKGAKLVYVPVTTEGELDRNEFFRLISKKPKLFAFTRVSNVLGTINPAKELISEAKKYGVTVLVDACQSVPHMKVDVKNLGADFLVFSGHKLYAPFVGVLYGKQELLEKMEPVLGGGEMIKEVTFSGAKWNGVPYKFEAGTPNIEGAIGLGVAIDYINKVGMSKIEAHEKKLVDYCYSELKKNPLVEFYGPKKRAGVVSFNFGDMHAHDVSSVLDEEGVCVRSGHHCAQPLMSVLNIPACARVSVGMYTTKDDIDKFLNALKKAKEVFGL
jgi:cysteine desulfurase/selenocysteine lyase